MCQFSVVRRFIRRHASFNIVRQRHFVAQRRDDVTPRYGDVTPRRWRRLAIDAAVVCGRGGGDHQEAVDELQRVVGVLERALRQLAQAGDDLSVTGYVEQRRRLARAQQGEPGGPGGHDGQALHRPGDGQAARPQRAHRLHVRPLRLGQPLGDVAEQRQRHEWRWTLEHQQSAARGQQRRHVGERLARVVEKRDGVFHDHFVERRWSVGRLRCRTTEVFLRAHVRYFDRHPPVAPLAFGVQHVTRNDDGDWLKETEALLQQRQQVGDVIGADVAQPVTWVELQMAVDQFAQARVVGGAEAAVGSFRKVDSAAQMLFGEDRERSGRLGPEVERRPRRGRVDNGRRPRDLQWRKQNR